MLLSTTLRVVKFYDDFYFIGYDHDKVKKGIEDLTKLADIDNTKDWNVNLVASKKIYYKDIKKTKDQVKKIILDIGEIPEL